ncbi:putative RNA ligase [uncultured Caudovirales phage]|uniref:Putative RNA ligase n=1 Tax=uncultured Caudovirales phage TaxID=2100421 RepID=A0A6J5M8X9_9CAUD|nr:putative RNA ligase [uncultured Caudovirales phage]
MENTNSVCYVARINEIKPIPGADNIEQGVIGGWNCIIKKGEYKADDLVVVATTDAVIPEELSDAMNVTNYLRKGQRVRTIKLRGMYSECLIIPITYVQGVKRVEGTDVMDMLGIFKYEPPAVQVQLASGRKIKYHQNPNFTVYHKFPNIKNVTGMFTEDDHVQITRKLHGTNARYGIVKKRKLSIWDRFKKLVRLADEWVDYEFVYGSHNVEKGSDTQGFYDTDVWREAADKYDIKRRLWHFVKIIEPISNIGSGITIYGEIYGPGIQKNYDYGLKELEFAVFDITINGEYQSTGMVEVYCEHTSGLNLPHVPVLYEGAWSQEVQDQFTFNRFIEGTKVPHEGIVIKHTSGQREKIAKVINPDYLIYGEKHDVGDSH